MTRSFLSRNLLSAAVDRRSQKKSPTTVAIVTAMLLAHARLTPGARWPGRVTSRLIMLVVSEVVSDLVSAVVPGPGSARCGETGSAGRSSMLEMGGSPAPHSLTCSMAVRSADSSVWPMLQAVMRPSRSRMEVAGIAHWLVSDCSLLSVSFRLRRWRPSRSRRTGSSMFYVCTYRAASSVCLWSATATNVMSDAPSLARPMSACCAWKGPHQSAQKVSTATSPRIDARSKESWPALPDPVQARQGGRPVQGRSTPRRSVRRRRRPRSCSCP